MRCAILAFLLLIMNSIYADELVGFAAYENGDYSTLTLI